MTDTPARTWKLTLRGDSTGMIAHEYLCPEHGRFTAEVPRSDVPDEVPCPAEDADTYRVVVDDGQLGLRRANYCGLTSQWSPGGVSTRVKQGEVVQGKVETNGLPPEVCMSTRELADGMPLSEFKARRAKVHADLAIKKMRAMTGRGGKVMR
jgi:hypothetical protein